MILHLVKHRDNFTFMDLDVGTSHLKVAIPSQISLISVKI